MVGYLCGYWVTAVSIQTEVPFSFPRLMDIVSVNFWTGNPVSIRPLWRSGNMMGSILQEQHEEWMVSRRYFSLESMAKLKPDQTLLASASVLQK
ncbi:protein of unknown function [Kyrpidia spormannii]|uniref:Uncharacterized protein n=2 Tax=Kyrpidia spormannii TaxID=2055160 RepID=A0ACA8ZCI1_9BACL|nr:protein of unknown function [Kyrpidia spormannii]CAB3395511.1 protein of unknown function [Kyrpidia spormannii]